MADELEQVLEAVKGRYRGFGVRFRKVEEECVLPDLRVTGRFYYPAFRDGAPEMNDFVTYIYHQIIPFTLPRSVRAEKDKQYRDTSDPRYIHELTDQARELFVRARKSEKTTGEPGELILFILLEAVLAAPQIACKMYLKTSENVPVHGSDGIHLMRGEGPDDIVLLWGESKTHKSLADGLEAAFESIADFLKNEAGRTKRDRDLDILVDHMDVPDGDLRDALLRYFDPYEEMSLHRSEAFAVFVGFDFSAYGRLSSYHKKEREGRFQEAFRKRIRSACELAKDKIKDAGLNDLDLVVFLMPFPAVEELRRQFLAKVGGYAS